MVNLLYWPLGFLRAGTSGLTSQAFGAGDKDAVHLLFTRALVLAVLLGVALILLQLPLKWIVAPLIGADAAVRPYAETYFTISLFGAPAMLVNMAVSGWFLGMQDSRRPMLIAVTTNLVNIVASIILAFPCGLGFEGTALGTLIANWLGLALSLLLAARFNGGRLPLTSLKRALQRAGLSRFFKVNSDIFLRSFCIMAVSLAMTAYGARQGSVILAANGVMMQFFLTFSYFMDGFAFAGEALTGRFVGEKNRTDYNDMCRCLMLYSVFIAVVFTLLYTFGYSFISGLLTESPEVMGAIDKYSLWLMVLPAITVAAFIFDGIYIGFTATRIMLFTTLAATVAFFAIYQFRLLPLPANHLLWLAFMTYLLIRGVLLAMLLRGTERKLFENC